MKRLPFFLVIFFVFSSSDVYARSVIEGFWIGGVGVESKSKGVTKQRAVEVDLTIAEEYGHLIIQPDIVSVATAGPCEYFFKHVEGKIRNVVLKPGEEGQVCGRNPKILIERRNSETLFFSIQDARMALAEKFPLKLRHGFIPQGARSVMPENFDIMDVEIGMLRAQAEEQLNLRRYKMSTKESRFFKGPGWIQNAVVYTNGENRVYVIYSPIPSVDEGVSSNDFSSEHVVLISRNSFVSAKKKVSYVAFVNSISLKYGLKEVGGLTRYYDYDGNLSPRSSEMLCDKTDRQVVVMGFNSRKKFRGNRKISADCGSVADIAVWTDSQTGLVTQYDITLWNYDVIIESDWQKISYQTQVQADTFLSRLSVEHIDIDL